ncbi:HAD-IA family hydrolase [Streptomyces sp. APSN-46.1]|uniref:HAD-IA family hydrolase n=1 Tax=Streptomyces sp. APSN-46.1 TaxID=2929049 RepID=UPI001FB1E6E2|nr:HAD-IA family hydrolase [Streptomyces sp. APSN-46.1]MCJ1677463.1 HAD-IA family hydrolase [Streptomyces sp. APSN-46.1]
MRCDALSLDLDETLIDYSVSSPRALEAIGGRRSDLPRWYEVSAQADRDLDRGLLPVEEYERERIRRFHDACHGRSLSASELDELVARRRGAVLASVRLFPDAVRFLDTVAALGIRCVAVSNSFAALREDIVRHLDLAKYFSHITYCGDGVHRKPAMEAFSGGLAALGGAEAVVHIGDEYEADVIGAGNAGLQGVHVNRSGGGCAHAGACVASLDVSLERHAHGVLLRFGPGLSLTVDERNLTYNQLPSGTVITPSQGVPAMSSAPADAVYRGGDPIAEIVRSGFTESFHRGSVAVTDSAGTLIARVGDAVSPVFPRSAIKPVLAVAMLRAGWKPAGDAELAVAAASHRGEPAHVERVEKVLSDAGLDGDALRCPPDFPMDPAAARAIVAAGGEARRVYMTCSGKHAAMLATCVANGWDTATYLELDHPLQKLAASVIEELTGETVAATGVDGCGVPIFAVGLTGLARAMSRLVEALEGTEERAVADAMRAHPHLVEGTDQTDVRAMQAVPGLLAKFGAEGLHLLAAPGAGAVAVKVDDGMNRASMPVALDAFITRGHLTVPESAKEAVEKLVRPEIWGGGRVVGHIRTLL